MQRRTSSRSEAGAVEGDDAHGRPVAVCRCVAGVLASVMLAGAAGLYAQEPVIPVRDFGQGVIGAYEGWYENPDGSFTMLVGYFNRNLEERLDIPVGPDNRIEPGGPDLGQPTYFLPRRQWGVFTVTVPPDFGDQVLTWSLTANGETTSIPLKLDPQWAVEPLENVTMGNSPPVVRFEEGGTEFQGPPLEVAASFETLVADPVTLSIWVTDDLYRRPGRRRAERPPLGVAWSKLRGPDALTFDNSEPEVPETGGQVTVAATFDAPGDYLLRAEVTDSTGKGGGGSQCCWTTVYVTVTVHP